MAVRLQQVQQAMSLYSLSLLLILGTVRNLLLIQILLQRTHRRNSFSLYLLSASVVNLILILCNLPLVIYSPDHVEHQNVSLIWCKIRSYLFNALLMLYRWYRMAACVDRAAMCSPRAWVRAFSEVRMARRAILVITTVWLLIPIHLAVFFRIESNQCVPASGLYVTLYSVYSIFISGSSPPIVMISFGLIAYRNLRNIKRQVIPQNTTARARGLIENGVSGRGVNAQHFSKRDQQLIVTLLCEVILYVCTNMLYAINSIYSLITSVQAKTAERMDIETFVTYLSTEFLLLINNCFPFYLYCIVSSEFRKDVRQLFSFPCRSPRVSPEGPHPRITLN